MNRCLAHSITLAVFALILAVPRTGNAQGSQDYGPDTYVSIATAFINAAENDDPDAIDAMMTPITARFDSPDVLRPFLKLIRDAGAIQNVEFVSALSDTGTVVATGANNKFILALSLYDNKIIGFTYHGLREGDSVIVRRPDADYMAAANTLATDINADNIDAIEQLFTVGEQRDLPLAKAKPYFEKVAADIGQITKVGQTSIAVDVGTFALTADKGTESLVIDLDTDSHIAYMTLHGASGADPDVTNKPPDDYLRIARQLADDINNQDVDSIEALFAPNVSEQLPPDKAADYFGRVHTRCGTINNVQFVTFSGDEITIELDCDNATLTLKFSMDSSYHITWFHIALSSPAGSDQQSPVVLPEISLKRPGDTSK